MNLTREQIEQNWNEIGRKFPLVCGLKTLNSELTIYAVLQQACHQFDYVIITDDGSTDGTMEMIKKAVADFEIKNLMVVDVSEFDPWPDQKIEKKEDDHHITRASGKTHAKAQMKNYQVVQQAAPTSIYVSLKDDVR